jgi:hypothetical protein
MSYALEKGERDANFNTYSGMYCWPKNWIKNSYVSNLVHNDEEKQTSDKSGFGSCKKYRNSKSLENENLGENKLD